MKQSRIDSMVEVVIGTFIGFFFGVLTQIVVLPFYGMTLDLSQNMTLCAIFTTVSLFRGYAVRRWCDKYLRRLNKAISTRVGRLFA